MNGSHAAGEPARFNLSRWFALTALISIAVLALVIGMLLNRFITQRLLWQEAALTKEFVQSLVQVERSLQGYFADPSRGLDEETQVAFRHIAALPDMLRANIYDPGRRVIWSSDGQLAGRSFGANTELDIALAGGVVSKSVEPHPQGHDDKPEHLGLIHPQDQFVEIYVPIFSQSGGQVLAVVEFYKNPRTLHATLSQLRIYLALGALTAGALLFLALWGLVRRADGTIRRQQRQLVEAETLAVIGEMSAAVAHGIRNPLATIRSSAELIPGASLEQAQASAADIVAQSDRLEAWVRELLAYARPLDEAITAVDLAPLVRHCLENFERETRRRDIRLDVEIAPDLPAVRGHPLLLGQVLASVVANAVEAMDRPGRIVVRGEWASATDRVTLSVVDDGPGMSETQRARAGKPFHTTKPRGLGVGLALARRVLERFGGLLEISSSPGRGTTVRLHLRQAG